MPTAKHEETRKRRSEEEGHSKNASENPGWRQCASRARRSGVRRHALRASASSRITDTSSTRSRAVCICDSRTRWWPAGGRRRRTRTAASFLRFFVSSTLTVGPSQRDCERRELGQSKQPHRVLLQDQRPHLIAYRNLFEVCEPSIGRDPRVVGSEQHFVFEHRVRVLDQRRREVFR